MPSEAHNTQHQQLLKRMHCSLYLPSPHSPTNPVHAPALATAAHLKLIPTTSRLAVWLVGTGSVRTRRSLDRLYTDTLPAQTSSSNRKQQGSVHAA